MIYYVVCINKHPTHTDPHNRIQYIGVNKVATASTYDARFRVDQVISMIRRGDVFYSRDARGDQVKLIIATHLGHEYVKTESDGIRPDNLLAKPECAT